MSLSDMINTHPHPTSADLHTLVRCIEDCFSCSAACTSCADACLGEDTVQDLVRCIRLDLDCADVCATAGRVLTRQTESDPAVLRATLTACAEACRVCAVECERHAEHHDHCRVCAESCRRCEQSCNDLLATIA
jgi:hypothetical protein